MLRRRFITNTLGILLPLVLSLVHLEAEASSEPWPAADLLEPGQLAGTLSSDPSNLKILYVGFPVLYRGAHISGATLAGPCSKPEALDQLRSTIRGFPRGSQIVIYCGCCPFDHCPNVRPAYRALQEMKFTRVRVLYLPTNLHTDWVTKGYPTQKSST